MKNRLYTYIFVMVSSTLILTACKKEAEPYYPPYQKTSPPIQTMSTDEIQSDEVDDEPIPEHNENYTFPQMGNTPEDFIPKGTAFQNTISNQRRP
ncbi:hypothetical protein HX017_10230 [Myroides marinus]|uniref:hypothetical protein n=1 Tax=Myroides marinus TaxID=703342 RepID=UPI002578AE6F|nr:hypothetical protein [Myroides marinus]MDM1347998.1 hypothetical protein [Myroides marinus]MDM1350753.1 hypothetical protein [Myroides marinus]MDM1354541.1 hypothetical protein [Myroides marinus]MDM1357960.1 hypothetical protein [Myroides marinus]MDM1365323.1 hypothetical protein [Myroides marinus]